MLNHKKGIGISIVLIRVRDLLQEKSIREGQGRNLFSRRFWSQFI